LAERLAVVLLVVTEQVEQSLLPFTSSLLVAVVAADKMRERPAFEMEALEVSQHLP
jgi:hypothetical protein